MASGPNQPCSHVMREAKNTITIAIAIAVTVTLAIIARTISVSIFTKSLITVSY